MEDLGWAFFGAIFIFGWVLLVILVNHLRAKQRLRLKEMAHNERMMAMEKGVPVTEIPGEDDIETLAAGLGHGVDNTTTLRWIRYACLATGLVLVFFGIGWVAGFTAIPETPQTRGMSELATLGLIPAFTGAGLLLFYSLTKNTEI